MPSASYDWQFKGITLFPSKPTYWLVISMYKNIYVKIQRNKTLYATSCFSAVYFHARNISTCINTKQQNSTQYLFFLHYSPPNTNARNITILTVLLYLSCLQITEIPTKVDDPRKLRSDCPAVPTIQSSMPMFEPRDKAITTYYWHVMI